MKRILTYLLIVPLFVLAACGDRTDTDYTTDTTVTHEQDDRQMRAELQSWLDEIDRNFEQLQARAQESGEDWTSEIDDLRERRDEIRADLRGGQAGMTGSPTAGTTTQPGTDPAMGADRADDDRMTADGRADGVAPGTTGETQQPQTTTPGGTTGYGTTGGYATAGDLDNVRERMKELDSDIEELRLKTITSRDEFLAEVDTRMNEIDRELEAISRRDGTTAGYGTTPGATTPGTTPETTTPRDRDDRMAQDRTATGDGTVTGGTTTDRAYADRGDVNVEDLREDRDDVRESLADLRAGESEFDSEHENLAEQVADLRARVKAASIQIGSTSMTGAQSASVDRDVDV
jgi:cell division septum initiation protein DivIVA